MRSSSPTPSGTIALGYRASDSGEIRDEVSDTGVGISAEDIKRLFSAFTQLDDSAARKVEGTGLGLALCKQLAEYMGGQVGVISTVGRGSTFIWMSLRLSRRPRSRPLNWAPREWLMAEHQQRQGELSSGGRFWACPPWMVGEASASWLWTTSRI